MFKDFPTFGEYIEDISILESLSDEGYLEFIGLSERAMSKSTGIQPWKPKPGELPNPRQDDAEEIITKWFKVNIEPLINKVINEYSRGMKRAAEAAKNSKVIVDIKKPKSIVSKMIRGRDVSEMHDILRGSILVRKPEDMVDVDKMIKKVFRVFEREEKVFGGDKTYGYFGSYHYVVEVGKSGVLAEIQLMPRSMWAIHNKAHAIYSATREKIANDPNFAKSSEFAKLQKQSRDLFVRGSGKKVAIR